MRIMQQVCFKQEVLKMKGIFTAAVFRLFGTTVFFFVTGEGHESNISFFLWILSPTWTSDPSPAAVYPTLFGR